MNYLPALVVRNASSRKWIDISSHNLRVQWVLCCSDDSPGLACADVIDGWHDFDWSKIYGIESAPSAPPEKKPEPLPTFHNRPRTYERDGKFKEQE